MTSERPDAAKHPWERFSVVMALVWLVFLRRSGGTDEKTFKATKERYAEEEQRRREGTDDL